MLSGPGCYPTSLGRGARTQVDSPVARVRWSLVAETANLTRLPAWRNARRLTSHSAETGVWHRANLAARLRPALGGVPRRLPPGPGPLLAARLLCALSSDQRGEPRACAVAQTRADRELSDSPVAGLAPGRPRPPGCLCRIAAATPTTKPPLIGGSRRSFWPIATGNVATAIAGLELRLLGERDRRC